MPKPNIVPGYPTSQQFCVKTKGKMQSFLTKWNLNLTIPEYDCTSKKAFYQFYV